MDRFERCYIILILFLPAIYIPIWIDLKEAIIADMRRCGGIYIPIWIDLKVRAVELTLPIRCDLHSNMDRFERLKASRQMRTKSHLHSNMDRFERENDRGKMAPVKIFTFQYG